jgi:hypothetical protein
MIHGTFNRRGRGVLAAMFVGIGAAGVTLAPPAAATLHLEQYIEVPQCTPATGQECAQIPEVNFTAGQDDSIQAQFTANANGCSDAYIRFLVDHYPQSDWIRVSPNQTISSGYFRKSGSHALGVMAKGIEGGCNQGILNSWGGTVRLDSREPVVDPVGPAPTPILPPCLPWINAPACR